MKGLINVVLFHLLHPVLLHLQLAEAAELGHAAHGQHVVVPVGVLLPDLLADREESVPCNLQRLVAVVAGEPGVQQTLVRSHPRLLLLDQQLADEVLALLAHVLERLRVELPVAVLHVLQRGHVVGAGEGRQA